MRSDTAISLASVGSLVDFETIIPDGMVAARRVRRGAPSSSLGFVDERAAVETEPVTERAGLTTEDIVSICANIGPPKLGKPRVAMPRR
jgi:hypothetical protein